MKHEKTVGILAAAALAFLTAWGAVGCMVTAFDLPTAAGSGLVLVCGAVSCLSAVLLSFRYGGLVLLCLAALAAGYIHREGTAAEQFLQLVHRLTTIYDRAYGCGVLELSELPWNAGRADWPLGILGSTVAMAAARTVVRQKSVWLPMLVTILPLCSCIVVTDTVPAPLWLMLVMAGLLLLLLTSTVRRENAVQGNRLLLAAALPVAAGLVALFLIFPQGSYGNRPAVLRENILIAAQNVPKLMETSLDQIASGFLKQPPRQVDLADLGARIPFTYPVMEVTAEKSGTLYLREQDYDQYDGLGWSASADRNEAFSGTDGPEQTVVIQTKTRKNARFLPYYPGEKTVLTGGYAENTDQETRYSLPVNDLPETWRQSAYGDSGDFPVQWQAYLSLPDRTRQEAVKLLDPLIKPGQSNTAKADSVAALVLDSARYDLDPGKMPAGETDFALWFLRSGESGYCVHFATAATVLLRSAGVPARYVTGYLVDAVAGEPVTVTEENAHAWAEYYEPNLGVWLPLEATPAGEVPAETAVPRPAPAMPTAPVQTEPVPAETVTEAEPAQTQPTEASETSAEELPEEPPAAGQKPDIPKVLLMLPVLALGLAAQRSVRLTLRRRWQRTGDVNKQALYRWRESVRLARMLKESPTEELIHLAQKAKFSQHELTAEELMEFDSFNRTCLRRLKKRPWYRQLVYRYLYAAY